MEVAQRALIAGAGVAAERAVARSSDTQVGFCVSWLLRIFFDGILMHFARCVRSGLWWSLLGFGEP
jgi:hypothetical protein